MKLMILVLVVTVLAGCAKKYWHQEGKTLAECQCDLAHAQLEATKHGYVQPSPFGNPMATGAAAGIQQGLRENEIAAAYMRAKGYRLISQDEIDQIRESREAGDPFYGKQGGSGNPTEPDDPNSCSRPNP